MPTSQAYRFTIQNAANTASELVVTSVRGGTNPYIESPPSGDGQEVDVVTGGVRTGAYNITVVDVATGTDATGTIRVVTSKLFENAVTGDPNRLHLLSRRAYIEVSSDGGVTWPIKWIDGYVTGISQLDAVRYSFTVSSSRRFEQTKQVFTWQSAAERAAFPRRGCVIGGPIIEGLGGSTQRTIDSGGWEYQYLGTTGTGGTPVAGDIIALKYWLGAFPAFWEKKEIPNDWQRKWANKAIEGQLKQYPGDASAVGSDFAQLRADRVWASTALLAIVTHPVTGDEWLGVVRGWSTPTLTGLGWTRYNRIIYAYVQLIASETSWPNLPLYGTKVRFRLVTRDVSEWSPLYIQDHPVEIAAALYGLANLPVNTTAKNNVKAALGPTLMLTARITKAETMASFLEKSLFGPFGFSARVNSSGEIVFFTTRVLNSTAPSITISTNDIVGDTPPQIFDVDESSVVTAVNVSQIFLTQSTFTDGDEDTFAPDGIAATEQAVPYVSGDTSTYSTRMVSYDIPGMVTDSQSFIPTFQELSEGIARELFNRFGRGAPTGEVAVLRNSTPASLEIGDFAYLTASYYPNKNYRIGESSVGARVVQIVRREERPESIAFKFIDAGPYVLPDVAPTISIQQSSIDTRRLAEFKIDNAAAINSNGNLVVAVQWGTGSTTPSGGALFTRYQKGYTPSFYQLLPAVVPGTRVWARARTEQEGRFPSAWTGWVDVTLATWAAPTGVTIGTKTDQTVAVSWSLNGNTLDSVDVYIAPGTTAPSKWLIYRVNTLPAGTTSTTIRGLDASTNYIVGIAFRDSVANVGQTPVTATFTTNASPTGTATAPVGLQFVPGIDDASLEQGVALALFSAAGASQTVIERSTTSGSGFAEIAVVSAETLIYYDILPKNGTTYYYRIKHRTSGQSDSTATAEVSGTATGINTIVVPAYSAPSLKAVTTPGASSYDIVVTWDGTIVYNLDGVSQSVSGWTSPRTVNVTRDTGTATKVAAFAVSKTGVTVSESVNIPPTAPVIPLINNAFFSNGFTPGDGGGSVDITWSVSDMPSGVTYNIDLVDVTGDPITDASASYTNVTSPYTASIALGDNAEATCVIQALVGGITIATFSFRSAI